MENPKGILYLVPTPLGEVTHDTCLPAYNLEILNSVDIYIVEEVRTARRFLKKSGITKSIDELTFRELNEHTEPSSIYRYLDEAIDGRSIALLSEAGVPCVADPGSMIVSLAHSMEIQVKPLVGPSSLLMALMASGLNGQEFVFHGYLPVKPDQRAKAIRSIDRDAINTGRTHLFIEAPYRNNALLKALIENCDQSAKLCVATDISLETEFICTKPVRQWKSHHVDLNKKPTVFLVGR